MVASLVIDVPLKGRFKKAKDVIVGLGTDIIEIVRIGQMIERHGEIFLNRIYTDEEIRYCQRRKEMYQHFAGRWAAKEAVMKTLGTGFVKGIGWKDIEVSSLKSGQPTIVMHGSAGDFAKKIGIASFLITISHCRTYATATAVALQGLPTAEPQPSQRDERLE